MDQFIREHLRVEKRMGLDTINGNKVVNMKANGNTIILMEKGNIIGLMGGYVDK